MGSCPAADKAEHGMARDAGDHVVAVLAHGSGGVGHCGIGTAIGTQSRLIADVESHAREAHRWISVRLPAERKTRFATRAVPAVAMAVALLVTACGSAGNSGPGGGPSSTHAPASSTTSAGGGVMTLTLTVTMTGAAPGGGSFSVKYPPLP